MQLEFHCNTYFDNFSTISQFDNQFWTLIDFWKMTYQSFNIFIWLSNIPKHRLIQYQFFDFKADITVISRMVKQGVPGVPVVPAIFER